MHKIRNLDITIFPRTSEDSSCDYGNVIPTADGCLGILAGFPNNGFLESGMKARIEGMISLAQETTGIRGEDLLYKLDRALRSTPIPYLNLTLFYIETRTGEIGFLQCQELPILIHRQNRTVSLEQPKRRFYDFRAASRDIQRTVLKQGEFIVVLSDRLKELAGGERKILLSKLQNWTAGKEFRNTRELVLDFGRWLEAEAGKKTLYKASILSVGRVWN